MRNYQNVIKYIIKNHPDPCSLSSARVSLILYLIDWKSAMGSGEQLTDLCWETTPSGIKPKGELSAPFSSSDYKGLPDSGFSTDEERIMDHAIKSSAGKGIQELVALANTTYPAFLKYRVGSTLDLAAIAEIYKQRREELAWSNKLVSDQDWHASNTVSKF